MTIEYGIQVAYTGRRRRCFWIDWSDQKIGTGMFTMYICPHPDDPRMEFRWAGRSAQFAGPAHRPNHPVCTSFQLSIGFPARNPRPRPLKVGLYHNKVVMPGDSGRGWDITAHTLNVTNTLPVPTDLLDWAGLLKPRTPVDPAIVIGWWEDRPDPWCHLASDPVEWIRRVCPVEPYTTAVLACDRPEASGVARPGHTPA